MCERRTSLSEELNQFAASCRAKGLRVTHQRIEIFTALLKLTNHPTVEDVFERVRKTLKTVSLDTVYRTIATFEQYGLVRRVHHIDNVTRLDVNASTHHHLVCNRCNKIEDFYWLDFDRMKPPGSIGHWDKVQVKHVVISGICAKCQGQK